MNASPPEANMSFVALTSSALLLSGCRIVGDVVKASVAVGIVTVMGAVLLTGAVIGVAKR
jgi:hypothetical protein